MSEQKTEVLIPALFPHNHASNILTADNGDLLCAWFGGSKEGRPDISICISELKAGSSQWSKPEMLMDNPSRSEQNPVLFETPDKKFWLVYTSQESIYQHTAIVRFRTSVDRGHTWSEAETLFDRPGTFVRQPPVITDGGEIILPAYYSVKSEEGFMAGDHSVAMISADNGSSWKEFGIDGSTGLVHMCPVKLPGGTITGYFRSRKADNIYACSSSDQGRTWSIPAPYSLPNNNSSIQCTRLLNGHLAMVFNDTNAELTPPESNIPPWFDKEDVNSGVNLDKGSRSAVWGVARTPLAIAISIDEGKTWPYKRNLETGINCGPKPEFSYPSIKQTKDGRIHITYTYLRKAIKYVCISEDWVTG